MTPTVLLQEIRKMRFDEAYEGWDSGRLTQGQAAELPGMGERSFRRYLTRYKASGLDGLIDHRLEQESNRRAPVDEVLALTTQYRARHVGWNVKHFHNWYQRSGGLRGYTWVKMRLQGPDRDDGRRHQRALFDVLRCGRRHRQQYAGCLRSDRRAWPVQLVLQRPWQPLLA